MKMNTTESLELVFALAEGALLGVFFFAGLWWTVRKLESAKHVAFLFLGSLLLRTGIVVSGFYFILGDDWQHLLAGLLGFVLARVLIVRFTRISNQGKIPFKAG
jgi:F1F0 ATPase subunit 2